MPKPKKEKKSDEVTVTFKRAELKALRAAVMGDHFDVMTMNAALEKIAETCGD